MGRPPLIIELITRTRTKKSGGFVDERTKRAFVSNLIYVFFKLITKIVTLFSRGNL